MNNYFKNLDQWWNMSVILATQRGRIRRYRGRHRLAWAKAPRPYLKNRN
jgi:hypothetical protein